MIKKEKFFICERCGELTTRSKILHDCEFSGSVGMCYCNFTEPEWSDKFNDLDVFTPRIFIEYTQISKRWYDKLSTEKNEALRLIMFREIPKGKLLK